MEITYGPMTDERKMRIWQLWRQGFPMIDIARGIVKPYLLYHGGIEPSVRIRVLAIFPLRTEKPSLAA